MVLALELALGSLFPLEIVILGLSLQFYLKPRVTNLIERYLVALLFGTSLVVIPAMFLGMLPGVLRFYFLSLTICVLLFAVLTLAMALPNVLDSCQVAYRKVRRNPWIAVVGVTLVIFCSKFLFVLSFRPIYDGDALYYWISMGKVFWRDDAIPIYDSYHFWIFTDAPAISLLYAWTFSICNSVQVNAFRLLPLPFLLAYPLVVFCLGKDISGSSLVGCVALIIGCLIPAVDLLGFFYAFYPDVFSSIFAMFAVHCALQKPDRQKDQRAILCGLSINLAILFKYPIGLTAIFLVLLVVLSRTDVRGIPRLLPLFLIGLGLGLVGLLYIPIAVQLSDWSIPFTLVVIAVTILVVFHKADHRPMSLRHTTFFLTQAIAFLWPAFVWGLRSLLVGGSLFGIAFIRILPLSPARIEATSIWYSIYDGSPYADRFSPLSPLGFLIHPWMNLYFMVPSLVFLVLGFRIREHRTALLILFASYFAYLTGYGHLLSGRHLLMASYALVVILAMGTVRLQQYSSTKILVPVLVMYGFTSFLQYATISIPASSLPASPLTAIIQWAVVGYAGTYDLVATVLVYSVQILVISLLTILPIALALLAARLEGIRIKLARFQHFLTGNGERRTTAVLVPLFLALMLVGFVPYALYANRLTGGNLWELERISSWEASSFDAAEALAARANANEAILTYGDVVLSYLGWRVLDIYHNGLEALLPIYYSTNPAMTTNYLKSLGISFVLLPGPRHSLFAEYQKLANATNILSHCTSNSTATLIGEYSAVWFLYQLL